MEIVETWYFHIWVHFGGMAAILHVAMYCIIFVGDVTELKLSVNGACCKKVNFLSKTRSDEQK